MTVEEYAQAQAALSAEFVSQALQLATQFQSLQLTELDWLFFLQILFPIVQLFRNRSSELGRQFYDEQRELHFPDVPRHDMFLGEYHQEWFVEDMFPSMEDFLELDASDDALSNVILRATKNVENGARTQVIRSIGSDPLKVRWARVATGRETCEFCLTMISRGPVYRSAEKAGLQLDDVDARELFEQGFNNTEAVKSLMKRWHPGCDCLAVPVFDRGNWPGRTQFLKAQDLWIKYSKLVDDNPSLRIPQNGNQQGPNKRRWSRSEAVMAAVRRALYNGDINMRDFGVAP